jgi:outer membrane lipoprotein SlyB
MVVAKRTAWFAKNWLRPAKQGGRAHLTLKNPLSWEATIAYFPDRGSAHACPVEDTMKHLIFVLSILSVGLNGCAGTPVGGRDYHTNQVRGMGSVQEGVILAIRPVNIHEAPGSFGGSNYLGSTIGAALGGLLGGQVTHGDARYVAGTIGAAVGATLGSHVGSYVAKQQGVELDILLSNSNQRIIATQGADEQFQVGQRVRVTYMGGAYRVTG